MELIPILEWADSPVEEFQEPPISEPVEWIKENPITEGIRQGCLCCPGTLPIADMDMGVSVGFGFAGVIKDKVTIYSEDTRSDIIYTVEDFEKIAAKDPEHDWRIHILGPLSEKEYQRQSENHWVLIKTGDGFA